MRIHVLLISGSTRDGSTNTAALRTALSALPFGVSGCLFDGLSVLPVFDPDDDHDPLPGAVADLRMRIARADSVLFSAPEYAGGLPGTFKNLLDWTVGGVELYRKPVAWINVASEGRGTGAQAWLATVLGYVGANVIDAACTHVPVARQAVGADGLIADPSVLARLAEVLRAMARYVGRD